MSRVKRAGKQVVCPNCGNTDTYETTGQYTPNRAAHAGMIRLREPYLSWGWTQPVSDPTAGYGVLECNHCAAMLAPSGQLTIKKDDAENG